MNASKKEEHTKGGSQARTPVQQKNARQKRKKQGHQHKPAEALMAVPVEESKLVTITDEEILVKWQEEEKAERERAQPRGSETRENFERLSQELEVLQSVARKMPEEFETLCRRMEAVEESAAQQAATLKREQGESERQRLDLADRIQNLEQRLALLEVKETLFLRQQPIAEAPAATHNKITAEGSAAAALLKSPDAPSLQNESPRAAPQAPSAPLSPVPGHMPQLRKLEIFTANTNGSRQVHAGQSFGMRLWLDCGGRKHFGAAQMDYKAVVYAKGLNGGFREIVAEGQDRITLAPAIALDFVAKPLPPGTYRLHATVICANMNAAPSSYTTSLDAGLMFAC